MRRLEPPTILDALGPWAGERGTCRAFTCLAPDDARGEQAETIAFRELDRRARVLASHLRACARPGDRALLLYPHGLDYIIGLLAALFAGLIAVPVSPPGRRASERVTGIALDAAPAIALTTLALRDRIAGSLSERGGPGIRCLATDGLQDGEPEPRLANVRGTDVALLQYTSGSTGAPKGVRVTHGQLMANQRMIRDAFGTTPDAKVVGWLPLYHDMGLVGTVFHAIYLGVESVLMAPAHFLQRPVRWLQAISAHGGTVSGGPDFAFGLCVDRVTDAEKAGLDLRQWRIAFNGAERVRTRTMARFAEAFAPCGFRAEAFHPCYGLAEATLIVSGGRPRRAAMTPDAADGADAAGLARSCVASCGPPVRETQLRIVDPVSRQPLRNDAIGEIWVSGAAVADGYWRNETTARADDDPFEGRLAGEPGTRYLRTGDLGFLHDGELFPCGRLKDLVIVRGVNHAPEDLERTVVESHASFVRHGAIAFAVDDGRLERVVIVAEIPRRPAAAADVLMHAIRAALATEHQLAVDAIVLLQAGALPRTSSGKPRRLETKARYLSGELHGVAQWTGTGPFAEAAEADPASGEVLDEDTIETPPASERTPAAIARWLAALAGRQLAGPPIDIDAPLAAAGLDSLAIATLAHRIEVALGRPLPAHELDGGETPRQIAARFADAAPHAADQSAAPVQSEADADTLRGGVESRGLGRPPARTPESHPLTPGQLSLWLLHQFAPAADPYRIATTMRMSGPLDEAALRAALHAAIARHAALRTTFGDPPRQIVHPEIDLPLTVIDAAGWSMPRVEAAAWDEIERGIDLFRGPVCRFVLFTFAPDEHLLVIAAHHIVCDGWSMERLHVDLIDRYRAALAGDRRESRDAVASLGAYAQWQARRLAASDVPEMLSYWTNQLGSLVGRANASGLVADTGNGHAPREDGLVRRQVEIPAGAARALTHLARERSTSAYVVVIALLQASLWQATAARPVAFGTDAANRPHAWMRPIVGMLANQVVLRVDAAEDATFSDLLRDAHRTVREALRRQEVPFSWVVRALNPPRRPGRNPLFQLMCAYRNRALPRQRVGALWITPGELPGRRARFDATLALTQDGDTLSGYWEFRRAAVAPDVVEQLPALFESVARATAARPSTRWRDLSRSL